MTPAKITAVLAIALLASGLVLAMWLGDWRWIVTGGLVFLVTVALAGIMERKNVVDEEKRLLLEDEEQ